MTITLEQKEAIASAIYAKVNEDGLTYGTGPIIGFSVCEQATEAVLQLLAKFENEPAINPIDAALDALTS